MLNYFARLCKRVYNILIHKIIFFCIINLLYAVTTFVLIEIVPDPKKNYTIFGFIARIEHLKNVLVQQIKMQY